MTIDITAQPALECITLHPESETRIRKTLVRAPDDQASIRLEPSLPENGSERAFRRSAARLPERLARPEGRSRPH